MNTLVVIGYQGGKHCYLNMSVEEAIKSYKAHHGMDSEDTEIDIGKVERFEFNKSFCAYDVYPDSSDDLQPSNVLKELE